MSQTKYDLIIIGAGSGGLGAALGMLELGFNVLLIDKAANNIGGECLNTGCVPSKALLHIAKQIHQAKSSSRFGFEISGATDFEKVKEYIQEKQNSIRSHENVNYLREKGLNIVLGIASFVSEKKIEVDGKVFEGRKIVIATGSFPRKIDIPGSEAFPIYTNESVFEIDEIPPNFVFLGAGPVSIELAQAFSRLGSKVSVVDRGETILHKEESEISNILLRKLQEEKIDFYFNSEVKEIVDGEIAVIKTHSGEKIELPADAIFIGLGRELNFDSLKLENAGIETKNGKIVLNEKLQTTNKNVFVSGDAADNLKFSHAAEMHNMLLINNFLSPIKKKLNLDHFPWVTFTDPEIATFGLNENKLNKRKLSYEKLTSSFSQEDRAVTDDFEYGKLILFIEKKKFNSGSAKILGGSMIAPNAGEVFQELVLANSAGISLKAFINKIYPYPTAANIHKTTARNRFLKQFTPLIKKALVYWYRIKA